MFAQEQNLGEEEHQQQSAVADYVLRLMDSGREVPEIVEGVERYFDEVNKESDAEINALKRAIENEQNEIRTLKKEEVVD